MPFATDQLHAKASASAKSLSSMTPKQREATVSDVIANDFNTLRSFVAEAHPNLEPLLPAALAKTPGSYGAESHSANYQDIQTFYAQLADLMQAEMMG